MRQLWTCAAGDFSHRTSRGKRKFFVTTDSKHNLPIAPNLLARDFTPEAPNQTWPSDITYIATDEGWLYPR